MDQPLPPADPAPAPAPAAVRADVDWEALTGDPCILTGVFRPPPFIFGDRPSPPAPDYTDLSNWSSHPEKESLANVLAPDGMNMVPITDRPADCFYVMGTNYQPGDGIQSWNAPVPDPITDEWCDVDSACQASAFNDRCRIFAPRYRQSCMIAHGRGLLASMPGQLRRSSERAVDLAYTDVENAFEHFIQQTGDRPIVIASHSQGSMMAVRLMEKFEDSKLRQRLVCAYILGPVGCFPADKFERCFPSLHPSKGAVDQHCIVVFEHGAEASKPVQSMEKAVEQGEEFVDFNNFLARSMMPDPPCLVRYPSGWESPTGKAYLQTNPLTWTSEPGRADASLHLGKAAARLTSAAGATEGLWEAKMRGEFQGIEVQGLGKVDVGSLWAEIACNGRLLKQPGDEGFLHEEWSHYYFNIRENAAQRVDAFVALS